MSKARTLANFVSSGNPLADGAIAASEVTGLSTVATTGAYNDLSGKPTLGTAAAQNTGTFLQTANNLSDVTAATARTNLGLATVAATGSYNDLSNKPTITATANDLSGGDVGSIPYQAGTGDTAMLAAGTSGYFLKSNGGAAPSWDAVPATTPAGSTGQVQYNNAGSFGALSNGTSGQVLTSAGTGAAPTWSTPAAGGFSNMQVFTSSTSWTVPTGVSKIKVIITAGGGGAGNYSGSGGGGAGSTLIATVEVTAGWSLSITVGSGGSSYTQGGNSQIVYNSPEIYLYAGGGIGSADSRDGGDGGTAANYSSGGPTIVSMLIRGGGGGGGFSDGGVGGSSYWGGGGRSGYNSNGSGLAYGSGGGGRGQNGAGSSSGAAGVVVIEY